MTGPIMQIHERQGDKGVTYWQCGRCHKQYDRAQACINHVFDECSFPQLPNYRDDDQVTTAVERAKPLTVKHPGATPGQVVYYCTKCDLGKKTTSHACKHYASSHVKRPYTVECFRCHSFWQGMRFFYVRHIDELCPMRPQRPRNIYPRVWDQGEKAYVEFEPTALEIENTGRSDSEPRKADGTQARNAAVSAPPAARALGTFSTFQLPTVPDAPVRSPFFSFESAQGVLVPHTGDFNTGFLPELVKTYETSHKNTPQPSSWPDLPQFGEYEQSGQHPQHLNRTAVNHGGSTTRERAPETSALAPRPFGVSKNLRYGDPRQVHRPIPRGTAQATVRTIQNGTNAFNRSPPRNVAFHGSLPPAVITVQPHVNLATGQLPVNGDSAFHLNDYGNLRGEQIDYGRVLFNPFNSQWHLHPFDPIPLHGSGAPSSVQGLNPANGWLHHPIQPDPQFSPASNPYFTQTRPHYPF